MRKKAVPISRLVCLVLAGITLVSLPTIASPEQTNQHDLLEVILSGIQYYDLLVTSGEGKVLYKRVQAASLADEGYEIIDEYYLTFDEHRTRMDISQTQGHGYDVGPVTSLDTGEGEWRIRKSEKHGVLYLYYPTFTKFFESWDPRWALTRAWVEGSVYKHLKQKGFQVKEQQQLGKIRCYLLENTEGERMWIAPDQGFRMLKYEHRFADGNAWPDRGIKRGTSMVVYRLASYQKYGEAWFPRRTTDKWVRIDEGGQEHLIAKEEIEVSKEFQLNHPIPAEKLIADLPEDAQVWVGDLRARLSKAEFLKRYNP